MQSISAKGETYNFKLKMKWKLEQIGRSANDICQISVLPIGKIIFWKQCKNFPIFDEKQNLKTEIKLHSSSVGMFQFLQKKGFEKTQLRFLNQGVS
jgi:hypothetical protein